MLYAYIGTSTRGPQYMLSNLVQQTLTPSVPVLKDTIQRPAGKHDGLKKNYIIIIIINCNYKWALPGGSGTTVRHNTQLTHHTK
jgi:hypothetical protein